MDVTARRVARDQQVCVHSFSVPRDPREERRDPRPRAQRRHGDDALLERAGVVHVQHGAALDEDHVLDGPSLGNYPQDL